MKKKADVSLESLELKDICVEHIDLSSLKTCELEDKESIFNATGSGNFNMFSDIENVEDPLDKVLLSDKV